MLTIWLRDDPIAFHYIDGLIVMDCVNVLTKSRSYGLGVYPTFGINAHPLNLLIKKLLCLDNHWFLSKFSHNVLGIVHFN